MKFVGIDVHKKMCQAAIIDEDGTPLNEIRFRNTIEGIGLTVTLYLCARTRKTIHV